MKILSRISNKTYSKYFQSIICLTLLVLIKTEVLDLTDTNFDQHINSYEIVFVNFHAEWCPFSQRVMPILKESDQILAKEVKEPNRFLFAKVNCDENSQLSNRYKISKFPTLKTFVNGKVMKKEYRGQRSQEAITQYVRELLSDPVVHIHYQTMSDLSSILYNKSTVIGYFNETPDQSHKYSAFRKVATDLKGFCHFYWVTNSRFVPEGKEGLLAFKSYRSTTQSEYDFMYETYEELSAWSTYMCSPVVREITFENAEEIIEEGLPLVILFHHSYDEESVEQFRTVIQKELINETSSVNFLTADGKVFEHPLQHINKTLKDMPLIAIDSFEHMYLFPRFEDLNKSHILANFISDLKSGKLHREYHFGPEDQDMTEDTEEVETASGNSETESSDEEEEENDIESEEQIKPVAESVFVNLAPSETRYSFRDEL